MKEQLISKQNSVHCTLYKRDLQLKQTENKEDKPLGANSISHKKNEFKQLRSQPVQ
jgi:hypothetical protein